MAEHQSDPAADRILCLEAGRGLVPVPAGEIRAGMAVFGILLEKGRVLLQTDTHSGLLFPPGGRLDGSQDPASGLRRLFRGATGLTPEIGPLVLVDDAYRSQDGAGIHLALFYYAVSRPRQQIGGFIDFENPDRPQWVRLAELGRSHLLFGFDAIQHAAGLPE